MFIDQRPILPAHDRREIFQSGEECPTGLEREVEAGVGLELPRGKFIQRILEQGEPQQVAGVGQLPVTRLEFEALGTDEGEGSFKFNLIRRRA